LGTNSEHRDEPIRTAGFASSDARRFGQITMMVSTQTSQRAQQVAQRKAHFSQWGKTFLSELAATSNVSAAARKADIHVSSAYDARRTRPEFNRRWQAALSEGYDNLELELLQRLRKGEVKLGKDAKRGARSWDNATAFRLLSAHRESAARARAFRENEDADAILASIDAKLDRMRQRALKAATKDPNDEE